VENGKLTSFEDLEGNEIYLWQYDSGHNRAA